MDTKLKFAFWGTDELSIKVLETLMAGGLKPDLIVTVPDKPQGRKMIMTPPPIVTVAKKENIEFIQPTSLKNLAVTSTLLDKNCQNNFKNPEDFLSNRVNLKPKTFDFFLVASYGKIIPESVLTLPKYGTLNVHPSLLPRHRGATPLEATILSGDDKTGVTIIVMDKEMDHGPILAQEEITLTGNETYPELLDELAELGGKLILNNLDGWISGAVKPREQDHDQATFTKKIDKEDGLVDLAKDSPLEIYRKYRAFINWPGIYFFIDHKGQSMRVIIKQAHFTDNQFIIDRVLPEGRKEISWVEFEKGYLKKLDTKTDK